MRSIIVVLAMMISFNQNVQAAALNNDLAWSPDGSMIALSNGPFGCSSVSGNHTILIIDAATNQELRELSGNVCPVLSVAWSSDSQRLAVASEDGNIQVWSAIT